MAIVFGSRPVSAGDDPDRPDLASVSSARHTEWIPAGIAPADYQPWVSKYTNLTVDDLW